MHTIILTLTLSKPKYIFGYLCHLEEYTLSFSRMRHYGIATMGIVLFSIYLKSKFIMGIFNDTTTPVVLIKI